MKEKYLTVFGTIEFGKCQFKGEKSSNTYIGGNGIVAALAAAKRSPVELMGVIGTNLSKESLQLALGKKISIENVEQIEGNTFEYTAVYDKKSNELIEHKIDFGVYGKYQPKVTSERVKNTPTVLFSGSRPDYNLAVLQQLNNPKIVAVSTFLYHLEHSFDLSLELIKSATHLFTNEKEYNSLLERGTNVFDVAKNLKYLFITHGKDGVDVITRRSHRRFAIQKEVIPLDPTNAGDVFSGTVMGMITQGYSLEKNLSKIITSGLQESQRVIMNDPEYRRKKEDFL